MKGKRCKPWLPILALLIVIVTVAFYGIHQLIPASIPKDTPPSASNPAKNISQEGDHPQLPGDPALPPKKAEKTVASRAVVEMFLLQSVSRLKKTVSSWPAPTPPQLNATMLAALLTALLWVIVRRMLYQRRIRFETYRGYQTLRQLAQQAESADLALIEQILTQLTELHEQLAKPVSVPVPLSHLPALYALYAHVDYTLNRVQDRRVKLMHETADAPKEDAVMVLMRAMDEKLANLTQQLSSPAWPAPLNSFSWMEAALTDAHTEAATPEEQPVELADNDGGLTKPASEGAPESAAVSASSQQDGLPAEESHATATRPQADRETIAAGGETSATGVPQETSGRSSAIGRSMRRFTSLAWQPKAASEPPTEAQTQSAAKPRPEASETPPLPPTHPQIRPFSNLYFWKKPRPNDPSIEKPAPSQPLSDAPGPDRLPQTNEETVDAEAAVDSQHASAQALLRKHMLAAMAFSAVPVPILDVAALTGIQLNLLNNLSALYGVPFNRECGKSVLVALLGGSLPTTALMWLSSLSKAVPGIGTLTGGVSLSASAGAVTYATGQVFIRHFEAGNALQDFDGKQQRSHFQNALKEGLVMAAAAASEQAK